MTRRYRWWRLKEVSILSPKLTSGPISFQGLSESPEYARWAIDEINLAERDLDKQESSKKEEGSGLSRKIIDRTFVAARGKLSAMKFPARNLLAMLILFVERIITRCIAGNNSEHTTRVSNSSSSNIDSGTSLGLMELKGTVSFYETATGATDFGGIYHHKPTALVNPASVEDIVKVVKMAASSPNLTVAARGNGHSINGQAQALNGVVLNMCSMKGIKIFQGNYTQAPYVDAGAGELWVDVLKACLKEGLAPRSWTDYLFLSVGGTLSNGGVSGQTFKFGPQISNVSQLHIVSGIKLSSISDKIFINELLVLESLLACFRLLSRDVIVLVQSV